MSTSAKMSRSDIGGTSDNRIMFALRSVGFGEKRFTLYMYGFLSSILPSLLYLILFYKTQKIK